jgi:hypothetical protein
MSIYLSGWQSGLNRKVVAVTILVLTSLAVALTPFATVLGQNTSSLGVSILQVIPASEVNIYAPGMAQYNGTVGTLMNLQGTIYTSNGTYNIIVGNDVVASGTAQGYYVNSNFTVPQLPGGGYSLILEDIKQYDLNSTGKTPETFTILTGYTVSPVSSYIQEGSNETLSVAVTGAAADKSFTANVTVVLPSPLKTNYSAIVPLGTTSTLGIASSQVTFPSSSFQPDQSTVSATNSTDYAGSYTVYFNQSKPLAESQFSVGFLDSTTYHRGQTATIKAIGYQPSQSATISITRVTTGSSFPSQPVTASSDGVISTPTPWTVPSNITVGKYDVAITTTNGTSKLIPDSEIFTVPGYPVKVTTVSLASEVVPNILVQAQDLSANTSYNSSSGFYGVADFNFEAGNYNLTAFWNGVDVGETVITVSASALNFNLVCQLADLVIVVQNENGTTLPFVNLAVTYTYRSSQSENVSGQTGPSGTFILNSTLTGISYTIQASMYNKVFNSGNNTVRSLPVQAVSKVVIICPTESLTINVVGYTDAPISGASLNLVELTNGLFYTATTDSSGSATAPVSFGMYRLQIYRNNILLNQTNIQAFNDSTYNVRCTLDDIQVSVSVVDYFGQPISNANVTVNGPASERFTAMTTRDGTTTFNNVIGGNLQIVAFAPGEESNYQAVALTVDGPTSVQIKMDGYIVFGPFLVQTSALLTIIIVLVAVVLLVAIEIYWRKRHRASGT